MNALPRVFLVDDEPHIRMLMKKVIQSIKCQLVGEATNGKEAIEFISKYKVDIVLMDINMPKMPGNEALPYIIELQPDAVIIMITSVADIETVGECLKKGAVNYVRKDTPIKEIRKIIVESWNEYVQLRRKKDEGEIQPEGSSSGD
ncbi:response regulator transcription factor [Limisalsivibrio acetivorans]|uniref:response regulator transcription factor n=1 Tax=Limisalsivibrio acetivorans TaxID=1304888 RepID=UPI0003B5A29B|nr:response regulator [Limisalsivibrio acetivorans]